MSREAIVALFQDRDRAWQRRDAVALAECHAEHATWDSPMQGLIEGRARIRQLYQTWFDAFPDLAYTTSDLVIDGNRAVQFFKVSGTQAGPFAGVPPTGRKIQFNGVSLYVLDESGLIVHNRFLYDLTTLLMQLGVLKTKAGN